MYYQNYEDYIRSILGYPMQNNDYSGTYDNCSNIRYEYLTAEPRYSDEILNLYPEIYKIINPMVCKICEANKKKKKREKRGKKKKEEKKKKEKVKKKRK